MKLFPTQSSEIASLHLQNIRLLSKVALVGEIDDFSTDFCIERGGILEKSRLRIEIKNLPKSAIYTAEWGFERSLLGPDFPGLFIYSACDYPTHATING